MPTSTPALAAQWTFALGFSAETEFLELGSELRTVMAVSLQEFHQFVNVLQQKA
jgi:hypothetical protein